jgi:dolichol-phosphate mannosyltransferase
VTLRDVRLGIVCPMANEAATASNFAREVLDTCAALGFGDVRLFAVLDRASTDGTLGLMRELAARTAGLTVVHAPENRNVVDAYVRGYREAIAAGCDWILEIDAGYSHSPQDITGLVEAMARGGSDGVLGSRFMEGATYPFGLRYLVSRGGSILANLLLGTRLSDMTSGFQLFTREAASAILAQGLRSQGPFFQTEMKYYGRGLRIAEVPIRYNPSSQQAQGPALADAFRTLGFLLRRRLMRR